MPYVNDDPTWLWLSETVVKAARWLGYVGLDQITDQRNAEPVIREVIRPEPWAYMNVGLDIDIPDAGDIEPEVRLGGFRPVQRYHLVMIGEKASLADVLIPQADAFGADLYLPTGEMSDTLIYRIGETAAADGRPMVVLYFADCDPAGHQMILSVTRKLQALKILLPGMPDFEAHRVALTPAQVREYGLPSTPLKATEKRASKWRAAFGIEQTEIDALAALRPDLLRTITRAAIEPFYDRRLRLRVRAGSETPGSGTPGRSSTAAPTAGQLARIRAEAERKLTELRDEIRRAQRYSSASTSTTSTYPDLPKCPRRNWTSNRPAPLVDSRWDFADQCRRLIDSKAYRDPR